MNPLNDPQVSHEKWVEIVRAKVGQIRYGTVQITVHDGRVTQVELNEKTRLTAEEPGRGVGDGKARLSSGGKGAGAAGVVGRGGDGK